MLLRDSVDLDSLTARRFFQRQEMMSLLVRCRSWAILKRVCFHTRPGPARYSTTVQHASTWLLQVGFALQLGSFETIETIVLFCTLRRLSCRCICCPVQAFFRFLRAVKGSGPSGCFGSPVCSSRCQEMSGDVRSYETVVMIWNVDETIIGKILNNWYILRFHQTNLPGYRQVYLWAKKHARPRYRNSGAFVHGTKFRNFGPIMEQGQMMTREQMMSRWSESIYSYLLYLLHFHHITGRQKGSWFLPLLLLRLLSLLLLLLLVKLYDTFCFRKDWKLQRVRSTWLTMCGQMVVLGSYISYMTSACGAGAVQIWVLWGPWAKASTRDPNFHRWGQGVDKIGPANWWHSTHSTHQVAKRVHSLAS